MEQNKDTRVIYFSDLFFSVLYAWRKILIMALVFALLLGCVQTVRYMKARSTESSALSEETLLEIAELENKLEVNQVRITALENYLSNSLIMNMNPYQVYQAAANIYVEAETPETTSAVIWAYQSFLRSCIASSDIAQTLNIHDDYLAELVSCQIVEDAGNLLTITTSYSDAAGAEQLLSVLLSGVNSTTTQVNQEIAPHTIRIISYPTVLKANQSLQKQQTEYVATLDTLKTERETIEAALKSISTVAAAQTSTNPVIMAIVGAVVGAFLMICIVIVTHLASDKVYSARTLKNRTDLRVLGRMPAGKRCKLDKWLCKLEKRACKPTLAATAANIRNYCNGARHLLVAGNDTEQVQSVMQIVREQTAMTVTCCDSLLRDVAALEALPNCDAVLLVETCHKSTYADINASMQLVTDQNKALVGCLLLGG